MLTVKKSNERRQRNRRKALMGSTLNKQTLSHLCKSTFSSASIQSTLITVFMTSLFINVAGWTEGSQDPHSYSQRNLSLYLNSDSLVASPPGEEKQSIAQQQIYLNKSEMCAPAHIQGFFYKLKF